MSAPNPPLFDFGPGTSGIEFFETHLTLRDLFAAFALAGLYLSDELCREHERRPNDPVPLRTTANEFAQAAYVQADAMLAERAKVKP